MEWLWQTTSTVSLRCATLSLHCWICFRITIFSVLTSHRICFFSIWKWIIFLHPVQQTRWEKKFQRGFPSVSGAKFHWFFQRGFFSDYLRERRSGKPSEDIMLTKWNCPSDTADLISSCTPKFDTNLIKCKTIFWYFLGGRQNFFSSRTTIVFLAFFMEIRNRDVKVPHTQVTED